MTSWTEKQFDELSWHDNHVHSLEISAGYQGVGTLLLRLGYIVERMPPALLDGASSLRIAPATLVFHDVSDLKVDLDYAKADAALAPFSIGDITRQTHEQASGVPWWRWKIAIDQPKGAISFLARGFTQTLTGAPITSREQTLAGRGGAR
jgi:hypothetical protein